jgi:hypothetical protein
MFGINAKPASLWRRLPPADAYTLSFQVRFCEGFDFARGGKLHGLGPWDPVTGGNSVDALGWSARLMWRTGGQLATYVYHQEQAGRFGDGKTVPGFRFEPGRFHQVEMRVQLNDPPEAANGWVRVTVDGSQAVTHDGLRFRAAEGDRGRVNSLLFSTFHGGSRPDWAPRHADGSFKTDCAAFDDFVISR